MRRVLYIVYALLAWAVSGCAMQMQAVDVAEVPLPPSAQISAIENEADRDYLGALHYWQQARRVVDERIGKISVFLRDISESYAAAGVALYEKREGGKALQQFIKALRYDAGNEIALRYLKDKYKALQYVPYTIKENDTFAEISEAVYGSPLDTFALIHFSGVADEKDLVAETVLHLPLLSSFYSQALLDYKRDIIVARNLFKEKKYSQLLPLSEKILKNHPGDEEASYLLNSSLVGLGGMLLEQEKYEEAVGALSKVDPHFKNVKEDIAHIRELQRDKLERDAKRLNAELFQKGEQLYSQRKYLEALEVFNEVDPRYDGVEGAIASVIEVMRMQADVHYKNGVKFFVNDNLSAAIKEWEKTLKFDPDHKKVLGYIAKAKQLLEKVKAID